MLLLCVVVVLLLLLLVVVSVTYELGQTYSARNLIHIYSTHYIYITYTLHTLHVHTYIRQCNSIIMLCCVCLLLCCCVVLCCVVISACDNHVIGINAYTINHYHSHANRPPLGHHLTSSRTAAQANTHTKNIRTHNTQCMHMTWNILLCPY